jgi:glycerol-3-phosphate dehydrogenase
MVMQDKSGRVIFLMPREDKILLGTTEIPVSAYALDENKFISQAEEDYLLEYLRFYFPKLNIKNEDIVGRYSGIRPLVVQLNEDQDVDTSKDTGKVSRHHKVFEPLENLFVILGGKYTTFRTMGQEITKTICARENRPYSTSKSLSSFTLS